MATPWSASTAVKGRAGELRALVGVEDVRPTVQRQGLLQVSTRNAAYIVIDNRQDNARRVAQSSTTARYTKPRAIGI
jgi:hypothetical protein